MQLYACVMCLTIGEGRKEVQGQHLFVVVDTAPATFFVHKYDDPSQRLLLVHRTTEESFSVSTKYLWCLDKNVK